MNNPKYLILFTIILWGLGGVLTRLISIDSPLLSLNLLFLFTSLTLFLFAIFEYRGNFLKEVKKIKLGYVVFGLFGYFFYYLGLTQSFHLFNSASETSILNYSFPIFTVLFTEIALRNTSQITSEKIIEYAGIAIGFISIVILATQGNVLSFKIFNVPAFLWGLSAGVAYGLFSVYSSKVSGHQQTMFLLTSVVASWIVSFVIAFPYLGQMTHLSLTVYVASIIAAFIVNGLGYMEWTRANFLAKKNNISISSVVSLIFILPVISLTLVSIFFHETKLFQPYFLLSLMLLLCGTVFCQKAKTILGLSSNLTKTVRKHIISPND